MSTDELYELARTLLASDPHAASWAWRAGEDDDAPEAYIDCSQRHDGGYALEVGDGAQTAQVIVSAADLAEVHRQLTVQLMVLRMHHEQADTHSATSDQAARGHTATAPAAVADTNDDADGM